MERLKTKIPPVAVFVLFFVVINHICHELRDFSFNLPLNTLVFIVCFILSGLFGLAGVYEFKRAKTTVNPVKVHNASAVVDTGVFGYSRNPMYLALYLLLFGFAYWQQNLLAIVVSFGFILYMNRFQIVPEEQALERLFGQQYLDYKQRVRRWI
ncbi:hypothetical protein TW81_10170 [Vibrio galatheae]|uniref:Protein-S-isoprenylcysteine methyltransferase n=1 Tax=Vibrio galatheae TaxID=579748 RepID=A0A0F4NKH4_9VIBR|nr:isoprenylcysteine carboxylmethyltransferase family protein [Vibrio galatheae]KJY83349.1 hypothetical protein TW81_10170 [Vibrio galatheae]